MYTSRATSNERKWNKNVVIQDYGSYQSIKVLVIAVPCTTQTSILTIFTQADIFNTPSIEKGGFLSAFYWNCPETFWNFNSSFPFDEFDAQWFMYNKMNCNVHPLAFCGKMSSLTCLTPLLKSTLICGTTEASVWLKVLGDSYLLWP